MLGECRELFRSECGPPSILSDHRVAAMAGDERQLRIRDAFLFCTQPNKTLARPSVFYSKSTVVRMRRGPRNVSIINQEP
jgi:hypothetical protein